MGPMPRTPRSLSLALLLVAVCVPTAAVGQDSEKISEMSDPRIEESSGLVISPKHEDLAYTINDGDKAIVFAIEISTGNVVGTTRVSGALEDTEAITIDGNGRMWLADLGDNDRERDDTALYRFPEPGPGDHSVSARRYPISYEGGPVDVEAFLVHPKTGEKFVASKDEDASGSMYALPKKLTRDGDNRATDLGKPVPRDASDATFTSSGSQALIRTGEAVHVFDPETWSEVRRLSVPEVENGETIAMEPGGRSFIIGSEGDNSPLIRVTFEADQESAEASPAPTPSPTPETVDASDEESDEGVSIPIYLVVAVAAVVVLALAAVWLNRRRQHAGRH